MPEPPDTPPPDPRRREARRRAIVAAAYAAVALALVAGLVALVSLTFPRPPAENPAPAPTVSARSATAGATTASSAIAAQKAPATDARTRPPSPAPAPSRAPAPAPTPVAPPAPALPLGMSRTLPGSRQMVIATGQRLGATTGTLRVFNLRGGVWTEVLSAPCRFGTNGLVDGTKRVEGSRMTPTGIWWPGTFVWGWHSSPPAGTSMPYRQTKANVWWSAVRNATYNTWVVSAKHVSGEHLVDVRIQYEYAWSTGYNATPNEVVRGRGTAIFLHVFDPPDYNNGLSAGCVAVSRHDMIRVFQTLDPALKPSFAIGTETPGTPTSISAY